MAHPTPHAESPTRAWPGATRHDADGDGDGDAYFDIPGIKLMGVIADSPYNVVYRGLRKGRSVAVKVAKPTCDAALRRAHWAEMAHLARRHHVGLVRTWSVGDVEGHAYAVMDFIDGHNLAAELQANGPLPEHQVCALALTLGSALAILHGQGLVHRNVKPTNIVLGRRGAKLVDFDCVAHCAEAHCAAPAVDAKTGTLLYSAPEQTGLLRHSVDGRADLYALGAVLFECLTGTPPYPSADTDELRRLHAFAPPPELHRLRPDASPALLHVVIKLLSKHPEDRFASSAAMVHALHAVNDPPPGEGVLERALADLTEALTKERQRADALSDTCAVLTRSLGHPQAVTGDLQHQEKSAALSRLALGLAHEINNPLAGVMYMFEALHSGNIPADRQQEYVRQVEAGLWRIQATTQSLLQYAQPEPAKCGACDWLTVLEDVTMQIDPALQHKAQSLRHTLRRGSAVVLGNASMLVHVLTQVLLNAIHASPQGARVTLRIQHDGEQLGLLVQDPGTGIPAQYLHRVCDPFFTTKPQGEGTGLGLATADRAMQAQGGCIRIHSQEGHGTTVGLWLRAWSS